ncbi:hypothetical protein V5799_024661 [Amblyomma americanum]|uniref:Uncharacterized protein n=1 Tax=Amblyomma americanum TaxID=6943 RepID=A0AAQ4EBX8_AMBAM
MYATWVRRVYIYLAGCSSHCPVVAAGPSRSHRSDPSAPPRKNIACRLLNATCLSLLTTVQDQSSVQTELQFALEFRPDGTTIWARVPSRRNFNLRWSSVQTELQFALEFRPDGTTICAGVPSRRNYNLG